MLDTILLKLDSIKERYLFLEKELSNSEIVNNHQLYANYSKEYSNIKKIVEKYEEHKTYLDNFSSTKLLLEDSDPEIKSLAQDELNIITEQLKINELEIKKLLIPENEDDEKDVFLEIRAGTGGDEAGLFVGDLFRMFTRVTERKKWKIELFLGLRLLKKMHQRFFWLEIYLTFGLNINTLFQKVIFVFSVKFLNL